MVPVIVLCGSNGISWFRRVSAIRYSEAALLGVSTILAAFAIFGSKTLWPSIPALLYVPLPLLLWAAARFGLGGLSLTLLSMALISIWYVIHGREPFPHVSMAQNVLSLQILFCMVVLPLMFLATVMDEQRRTQASLRKTSASLIEAQEQERRRIGRELHDDINQRLAMLAIEIDEIVDNPSEVQSRLQEARKRTTEISEDVQALSHELHASKLEHLGVVAGIKSWCNEFSARHKMEINCRTAVSNVVPLEIGISLFRILQEAVHNTFKHSGVKHLDVQLREVSGEIHLTITDSGRGFDVETVMQGHGLGLTSMRERARLVGGTISIETKPMHGTTIQVCVPLSPNTTPN
jgi:signal transduction histidine kinase